MRDTASGDGKRPDIKFLCLLTVVVPSCGAGGDSRMLLSTGMEKQGATLFMGGVPGTKGGYMMLKLGLVSQG